MDHNFLIEKAKKMRRDIVQIVSSTKSSHIGSMFSIVDILIYLFYEKIEFTKENCMQTNRDKFILSKGHASLALYSILYDKDIITKDDLYSYCKDGSCLIGHLDHKVKGVDVSTGSLGHGLSISAGMALANKMNNNDHRVYCLLGDGECNEGSVWEALIFVSNNKLKNLVIILDANKLQGFDYCEKILPESKLIDLLESMGLNFYEVNGHNFEEMKLLFNKIKDHDNDNATIIFAHTIKGKGVSFMENKLEWHYKSPNEVELKQALMELQ
ncbi:MAG: transketolase [Nanoarchaeota archaeon]